MPPQHRLRQQRWTISCCTTLSPSPVVLIWPFPFDTDVDISFPLVRFLDLDYVVAVHHLCMSFDHFAIVMILSFRAVHYNSLHTRFCRWKCSWTFALSKALTMIASYTLFGAVLQACLRVLRQLANKIDRMYQKLKSLKTCRI